jgi:hypothetical protein
MFGNDMAERIPDEMRRRDRRRLGFDAQFLHTVIGEGRAQRGADGQRADLAYAGIKKGTL